MASTCVWFSYPDSARLVLGCVRVCVLPLRLSKGKCIGSILDDRGRLRDAFYLIDKNHTPSGSAVLGARPPPSLKSGSRRRRRNWLRSSLQRLVTVRILSGSASVLTGSWRSYCGRRPMRWRPRKRRPGSKARCGCDTEWRARRFPPIWWPPVEPPGAQLLTEYPARKTPRDCDGGAGRSVAPWSQGRPRRTESPGRNAGSRPSEHLGDTPPMTAGRCLGTGRTGLPQNSVDFIVKGKRKSTGTSSAISPQER
jgi:hypothetical protein